MDALVQKKRLTTMLAINVLCLVLGMAAIVGHLALGVGPLLWVFVGAVVAGMAAQAWFITGWLKASRP